MSIRARADLAGNENLWKSAEQDLLVEGGLMRVMAKIAVPVEAGNRTIKDGSIGALMQRAAERWKPEAMYFTAFDGARTAYIVFDLPDSSDMVPFAEPFFQELNADVQIAPTMNGDDLQQGLAKFG